MLWVPGLGVVLRCSKCYQTSVISSDLLIIGFACSTDEETVCIVLEFILCLGLIFRAFTVK